MKVARCMTRPVEVISSSETIQNAAERMAEHNCGFLPVVEDDRLIGMITDRDITVRGIALGKAFDTPVADIMTSEVLYCHDDAEIGEVLANMGDIQVRRLPVVDRNDQLVGIVSLSDFSGLAKSPSGDALSWIARETGVHTQSI